MSKSDRSAKSIRIFISANEVSADENAAKLVAYLKKRNNNFYFEAIGGMALRKEGVKLLEDSITKSSVGFIESIRYLPSSFVMIKKLKKHLEKNPFHIILCVDGQGRNLKIAEIAKKMKMKVFYYFPPPLFIWGEWYWKPIKKFFDQLFCPFSENVAVYKKFNIPCEQVGHPCSTLKPLSSTAKISLKKKWNLSPQQTVIAILPGSRPQELNQLLPIFLKSAILLKQSLSTKKQKEICFLLSVAHPEYKKKIEKIVSKLKVQNIKLLDSQAIDVLSASDFAWIASGTATVMASFLEIPHAICYKVNKISYEVAKALNKTPYIGMINILAKKMICTEFINKALNSKALIAYTQTFLSNSKKRNKMQQEMKVITKKLSAKHPYENIFKKIMATHRP